MFAKRFIQAELLDHLPVEEARPNLEDLVRINARFGGHSVLKKTLAETLDRQGCFTLLDVGAASGDTAHVIHQLFPRAAVTCLDQNPNNMQEAPFPKLLANAFELPFLPGSFDYVLCSLFLHHFSDEQVMELLTSFYAIANKGLLVFDLERRLWPYLFLPITRPLFGWHDVTVHDGKISVRASFRAAELRALAEKAKISHAEVRVHRPAFRLTMTATK